MGQQRVPLRRKKTHSWCPTVLGLHIQARLFQVHSGRPGCNRRPGAWWFARVSLRGGLYSMLFGLQQTRDVFMVVHTTANAYKCQYTQMPIYTTTKCSGAAAPPCVLHTTACLPTHSPVYLPSATKPEPLCCLSIHASSPESSPESSQSKRHTRAPHRSFFSSLSWRMGRAFLSLQTVIVSVAPKWE